MKRGAVLAVSLLGLLAGMFSALAADSRISVESFTCPVEKIREMGMEGMFLPGKQPVNAGKPEELPLDVKRPVRGILIPSVSAVVRRALAAEGIAIVSITPRVEGDKLVLEAPTLKNPAATISLGTKPVHKRDLSVTVDGVEAGQTNEGVLEPGSVLVLSVPGKEAGLATVFFLRLREA
ncbi:hypothetical protein TSACC_150 [Terrimicrobium sacchariphilum]|uniref:Uncharacterized protein n=1 Tax=Terrimicrobium sacchariphilum TaxID=690879 RepID=A0A146G1W8_TERSA|nr:hypothetical protein [Terrimicrobium sacchariphilum]GAT31502.1 hypothetical protein TSACC_150 [Terrimicrobium sacchariphilum]